MRIYYNGLDLGVLELHNFSVEAVYDDSSVDYLYTRASVHATVIINGQVQIVDGQAPGPFMSYGYSNSEQASTPGFPRPNNLNVPRPSMPPAAGLILGFVNQNPRTIVTVVNAPPLTHATVRHRLETPRGQLYVFSGVGTENRVSKEPVKILLSSPGDNNWCDCKNGPIPRILSLNAALGSGETFVCDWVCETYINEAQQNNTSPLSALISNRFSQEQSVDNEGWTTIHTEGTAIYRTDSIFTNGISPDSSRDILFMPIPQGFTRVIDHVTGLPDVTGVQYGYTDTQQKVNFVAGPYTNPKIPGTGAATISVLHRQVITTGDDVLEGALSAYERTTSLLLNQKWLMDEGGQGKKKKKKKDKPKPDSD